MGVWCLYFLDERFSLCSVPAGSGSLTGNTRPDIFYVACTRRRRSVLLAIPEREADLHALHVGLPKVYAFGKEGNHRWPLVGTSVHTRYLALEGRAPSPSRSRFLFERIKEG